MAEVFITAILDILMGRRTIKSVAQSSPLSTANLQNAIQQITGGKTVRPEYQILVYKDKYSVYRDYNKNAQKLGSKIHSDNLIGLTDKQLTPEFAEKYISFDQHAMATRRPFSVSEKIAHSDFGFVNATADICPVLDEQGDAVGVFIISYVDVSLENQPFPFILDSLYRGLAYHFVKNDQYSLKIPNNRVTLTRREMECVLYVMIGLDTKKIAQHMRLSPRTVDNMIAHLKEKLSMPFRQDIAEAVIKHHWLNLL